MPLVIPSPTPEPTGLLAWDELIDEVLLMLSGYTEDQETVGRLSADCSQLDQSLSVDDASIFSKGLAEVGEEIIYVQRTDTGASKLAAVVRGFRGSVAQAHEAGELVRDNPRFPRFSVRRALEQTVQSLWPRLFAVTTVELTTDTTGELEVVTDPRAQVLTVEYRDTTADRWVPLRSWGFEAGQLRTDCGSGRLLRVRYATPPAVPAPGELFEVTGLRESARELVVLGACQRLTVGSEVGRGSAVAAEAQALQQTRPAGSGLTVAKYFLALFEEAVQREQMALQQQVRIRSHKRV